MKVNLQRWVVVSSLFLFFETSPAATVLLSESFSGVQPSGWSQDSAGVVPFYTWSFSNPGAQPVNGAGFDSSFAIFNSDYIGQNHSEDCYLVLPVVNASALTNVFLVMDEQYRSVASQFHQVEVSNDGGSTWSRLLQDSVSTTGYPVAVQSVYDITSIAAGHSNVVVRFHFAATWGWWWAIDNIKITDEAPLCSSPPIAGKAISTSEFTCSADSFSLSLINNSNGSGQTYQWQSSDSGFTWTDITNATNSMLVNAQSTSMYYHCVVTCSALSFNSDSVFVEMNPNLFCYCVPFNAACTGVDYISNVAIAGTSLNNSTLCDSSYTTNYSYFPPAGNTTATLDAGSSFGFSVTTNNNDIISIWIDYNHNLLFDADEWTQVCTSSVIGTANNVNILIPPTAINGLTGFRIRSRAIGSPNDSTSACTTMGSGETEDYIITIDNGIGIHEAELSGISVFPSPTKGQVEINFGSMPVDQTIVKIVDLLGNTLKQQVIIHSLISYIDLSNLANGIYFVQFEMNNRSGIRKIVLNK